MNFQKLAEYLGLEVDEYRELIDMFIDTGSADFRKIQDGMANSDSDQVMRSAHTIRGAAGNLGLVDVSETAKIIEESATENELGGLGEAINTLQAQFEAIEAFVSGA